MTPALAKKASRLAVVRRPDGSYQVAGDHGIYTVSPTAYGGWLCDCPGRSGVLCSHLYAVSHKKEIS